MFEAMKLLNINKVTIILRNNAIITSGSGGMSINAYLLTCVVTLEQLVHNLYCKLRTLLHFSASVILLQHCITGVGQLDASVRP